MTHITRLREQDLGPLVSRMLKAIATAAATEHRATSRPEHDLVYAGALAMAITGRALLTLGDLPIEVWADANRIAQDPASLTNQYLTRNHG